MRVVTFGEIMLRLSAPNYLKLIQANNLDLGYAGAEANVAVSLANYGVKVDFVTSLPNNPIAERCIADLRGRKVGVEFVQRCGNRMGLFYYEAGSNARPSKVYYDRDNSSFSLVENNSFDWNVILKNATWFHWSGITPAVSPNAASECLRAIKIARELGLTISCDINYRANLWKYCSSASEVMDEMVKYSDVILANEEDCEKVFGIKPKAFDVTKTYGDIDHSLFLSVCEQMMKRFPLCKKIIITLRGSISANHNTWSSVLFNGKSFLCSKQYTITNIVDRVGGGDSFMGGLIYGLINNMSDEEALEFATAASCLKHTILGDYNLVTVQEVEQLIRGDASGRVNR